MKLILYYGLYSSFQVELKIRSTQKHVDFVFKLDDLVVPIEVKSKAELRFKDTVSLRAFLNSHFEAKYGIIVYTGNKVYQIASNIYAVPWTEL